MKVLGSIITIRAPGRSFDLPGRGRSHKQYCDNCLQHRLTKDRKYIKCRINGGRRSLDFSQNFCPSYISWIDVKCSSCGYKYLKNCDQMNCSLREHMYPIYKGMMECYRS